MVEYLYWLSLFIILTIDTEIIIHDTLMWKQKMISRVVTVVVLPVVSVWKSLEISQKLRKTSRTMSII